ncbi:MAG: hypothetical protein ACFWUM_10690 [Eubacteriales bacterium]|jgi:hypothetical protein
MFLQERQAELDYVPAFHWGKAVWRAWPFFETEEQRKVTGNRESERRRQTSVSTILMLLRIENRLGYRDCWDDGMFAPADSIFGSLRRLYRRIAVMITPTMQTVAPAI